MHYLSTDFNNLTKTKAKVIFGVFCRAALFNHDIMNGGVQLMVRVGVTSGQQPVAMWGNPREPS